MQYTIRQIPEAVDAEIRRRARQEGKSLNEVAIEALARGVGLGGEPVRFRALGDVSGRWQEDPEFDRAIREQRQIDESLWK